MSDAQFPTKDTVLPCALQDYLERIGATMINWRRFIIKEYIDKYYSERLVIKLLRDGTIVCEDTSYLPTEEEQKAITAQCGEGWKTPKSICAKAANLIDLRKKASKGSTLYVIFDRRKNPKDGNIAMVHERVDLSTSGMSGQKADKLQFPWTFFSDGSWHRMEPDDGLPFFKPEKKVSNKIMIHEGAKAADACNNLKKDHPWYSFLSQYEHWGIIGGSHRTHLARFEELHHEKPIEVVYVCDNDDNGRAAVKGVSRGWGQAMSMIQFGADWPTGFDLADPFPKTEQFFEGSRYIGMMPDQLLQPATWATVPFVTEKGRTVYRLSGWFAKEWLFTITPNFFVSRRWPRLKFNEEEFNNYMRSFSDAKETSKLLQAQPQSKANKIDYMPNRLPGIHATKEGLVVNSYQPSDIEPKKGNVKLCHEYMAHLFPVEKEREYIYRWCATLIAKPEIRIRYSVLLISQQQGVGKTTLGQDVLAPIVGESNFGCPSETSIASQFTSWAEDKRLVLINEIYSGGTFEVYNKLKTFITEEKVDIRPLYMNPYRKQNWIHFIACSNTLRALKLDFSDRRWLVPKVTEKKAKAGFWQKFHKWLKREGGLEAIAYWAHDYVKKNGHVQTWEESPTTQTKMEMIHESMSPGQREVWRVLKAMEETPNQYKVALDVDLYKHILEVVHGGRAEKCERLSTIRSIAREAGWSFGPQNGGYKDWGIGIKEGRVLSTSEEIASLSPKVIAERGIKRLMPNDFSHM